MTAFAPPMRRRTPQEDTAPIADPVPPAPVMSPVPAAGLLVGAANDPLELEAEATSERIIDILRRHRSQPVNTAARHPVPLSALRRHAGGAPAVEVGAAGGRLSDTTSSAIDRLRGGGRPLSDPVRAQMEGAFGVDFSSTRVHTGSAAADLNRQVGAQAFTVGQDIVLGQGSADATNEADQRGARPRVGTRGAEP